MKRNKFLQGPVLPIAAAALLAMSVVGSTRAAFTKENNDSFTAELRTKTLSVALYEQTGESEARPVAGQIAAASDDGAGGTAASTVGTLKIVSDDDAKNFQIGKKYSEKLTVVNNGTYDEYVRVIVTRSWLDENGNKDTLLDPDMIELGLENEKNWIEVPSDNQVLGNARKNTEQTVYYYKYPLKAKDSQSTGESEVTLINSVTVSNKVTTQVTETQSADASLAGTITNVYDYNGKSFSINVEVDAVQTHSAADAILGAWGVKATFGADGTTIASIATGTPEQEGSSENGSNPTEQEGSSENGSNPPEKEGSSENGSNPPEQEGSSENGSNSPENGSESGSDEGGAVNE
jgi:hypothetical protein